MNSLFVSGALATAAGILSYKTWKTYFKSEKELDYERVTEYYNNLDKNNEPIIVEYDDNTFIDNSHHNYYYSKEYEPFRVVSFSDKDTPKKVKKCKSIASVSSYGSNYSNFSIDDSSDDDNFYN